MGNKYDITSLQVSSDDRYLRTIMLTKYSVTDIVDSVHVAFTNTPGDTDTRKRIVWEA
jgi:hypothetical protein